MVKVAVSRLHDSIYDREGSSRNLGPTGPTFLCNPAHLRATHLSGLRDDVHAAVPEDADGAVKVGRGEVIAEEDQMLVEVLEQVGVVVVPASVDRPLEQLCDFRGHFPDDPLEEQYNLKLKTHSSSYRIF